MAHGNSRQFMFWLFGVLYFVQGVITAYQLNFFKPHMDSEGIDADRIAIVASLALLPFILKAIFGLISDRINLFGFGYRLPYMVLGVVSCMIAFFIAFFIDPSANYAVLAGMVLVATFAMALFDTTADAYAVEVTAPEDHSRVQSFMTGGRAAGLIILSFVFGILAEQFGFSVIFLVIAVTLSLPLFMLARVREPAERPPQHAFDWGAFRLMLRPNYLLFAGFLILAWFTFQGIDGVVTFYMSQDFGASESTLGAYGTIKGLGMVVGAIGMSLVALRWGRHAAALLTLSLVTVGGLALSFAPTVNVLLGLGFFWGIVAGLHWTVYATLAMGITDLRIAGSMFALFQTMANIGIASGEGIATSLSDNLGFSGVFQLLALVNLIAVPWLMLVLYRFRRHADRSSAVVHAAAD